MVVVEMDNWAAVPVADSLVLVWPAVDTLVPAPVPDNSAAVMDN